MMYNVPSRTGMNVTADTQLRIAHECKNIFATKEASGNFEQINQIIKYKPADFMVISGDDPITLQMIASGAEGLVLSLPMPIQKIFRYGKALPGRENLQKHNNFIIDIPILSTPCLQKAVPAA